MKPSSNNMRPEQLNDAVTFGIGEENRYRHRKGMKNDVHRTQKEEDKNKDKDDEGDKKKSEKRRQ